MRRPLLALLIVSSLAAQNPDGTATVQLDKTTVILSAGKVAVQDLIDLGARFMECNILFEKAEIANIGPVELQSRITFDRNDAEEVVSDLLFSRGVALVPRGADKGIYDAISMMGPRRADISTAAVHRTVEEILQRPHLKQPVTTVFKLEKINANIATNALRPFFAAGGAARSCLTFGTAGDNSRILLSGFQHEAAAAIKILQEVDGQDDEAEDAAPTPAVTEKLERRIAELEKTVAELRKQLAELQKSKRN